MDDGSAPKGKDGGKPAKKISKSKQKKKEKKENLEDLKKELEIVRKHVQWWDLVYVRYHAEIGLLSSRIGIQSLWTKCVDVWRQARKRLVQILRIFFFMFYISMQCFKIKGYRIDEIYRLQCKLSLIKALMQDHTSFYYAVCKFYRFRGIKNVHKVGKNFFVYFSFYVFPCISSRFTGLFI